MRLSSLSGLAVLLLSSFVLAQHHDAGGAPSAPPPSAPSHVSSPAPAPTPAPTLTPNAAPAPSSTHSSAPSSAPSSPASIRTPESHVAPSPTSSGVSNSATRDVNSANPEAPKRDIDRVIPDRKISGENRIVGAPRIGENPPENTGERKPTESDLRKHICIDGPCKEPAPRPVTPESDLRKHICLNGPCTCPAGQAATKNGCVANIVNNVPEVPNACQPGFYWSGFNCVASAAECASINARASSLIAELHGLRARLDQACGTNPPAQDCDATKLERAGTRQRYEMLLTEGPSRCAALPPAASFYDEYQ